MRKNLATITLSAGALLAVFLLAFHLHQSSNEKVLSQFNGNQLLIAQQVSKQIESYFRFLSQDLRWFSSLVVLHGHDREKVAADIQSNFERLKKNHVNEISLLDRRGTVAYSTTAGAVGANHSQADFFSWARNPGNKGSVWMGYQKTDRHRRPITAASLAPPHIEIFLVTPLYRESTVGGRQRPGGKFAGVLMFTIALEKMVAQRSLLYSPAKKLHNLWIMDKDGTLLVQSEHPEMVMKNIREEDETCNQCHASFDYLEKTLRERQGAIEYQLKGNRKKVAAFTPMSFENISWIVVLNAPLDEVTDFVRDNLKDTLFLSGIVVLVMSIAFISAYRNYRRKVASDMEVKRLRKNQKLMEELREAHDSLENIFDHADGPIIVWDPEFKITRFNHAFERLTGHRAEDVIGKELQILSPYSNREESLAKVKNTLAGEYLVSVEMPILRKDGETRVVLWNSSNIYAKDGTTIVATIAQGHDITQRKRRDEELQKNYQIQNAINTLLRITLMDITFDAQVQKILEHILSLPWHNIESRGAIFLVENDPGVLVMKAQLGMPAQVLTKCAQVPFGECLCGRAALAGEIEVADCIDERHDYLHGGISDHGHYCVPISRNGKLYGIINIYLSKGYKHSENDKEFLRAVAVILTGIIERHRAGSKLALTTEKLRNSLGGTIKTLASMVERRDPYTAGHQRRVADLSRAIAIEMNLSNDQIDGLRMASAIHDIGKISVPAELLSMPGKLTDIQFNLIRIHAQTGHEILKDIDFIWPVGRMVLEHHERMNGSGYPQGLSGDKLLIESRIIAVADVVEAMVSHRPYRAGLGIDAALDEIAKNRGTLYDPEVVDACLRIFNEKGYNIEY